MLAAKVEHCPSGPRATIGRDAPGKLIGSDCAYGEKEMREQWHATYVPRIPNHAVRMSWSEYHQPRSSSDGDYEPLNAAKRLLYASGR